ncbi:MAG: lipid-binding SYLF domain-containing protein, partial [Pseudoxanthomonas sp.]|nr:lipid-binding SYLF domain-containing protein [Pseudoxanthomonas sp.]
AAGPVGRNASASTDGQLKAEIWSWSRARGLFAGVAVDGAVLQIDDAANMAVYGSAATPRAIFEGRAGAPSSAVVGFRDQLEESTAAARSARGEGAPSPRAEGSKAPATTAPATEVPGAPQTQGFQPVAEDEVRSEPLQPVTP